MFWSATIGGVAIGGAGGAGVARVAGGTVIAGRASAQKQATEKLRLYQEIISKQNGKIRQLELEKNEIKSKYHKTSQNNERLKYIIGVLEINNELKTALT